MANEDDSLNVDSTEIIQVDGNDEEDDSNPDDDIETDFFKDFDIPVWIYNH